MNKIFILGIVTLSLISYSWRLDKVEHKNILFILIDDLGWADLGCYGSTFHETPHINTLAEEGILFTNAYASASICSPTRASIMTGKHPARLKITDWIPGRQSFDNEYSHVHEKLKPKPFQQFLPLEEKTIAETLKEVGYQTFFAGKWHLGVEPEYFPEFQGFDINIGGWGLGYPTSFFSPYKNPAIKDTKDGEYLTDRLTNETIDFLKKRDPEKPFFAFLSYYAVHNPMEAKKKLIEKYTEKANRLKLSDNEIFTTDKDWEEDIKGWNLKLRKVQSNPVYAAMLETVDHNVGMLIQSLKDLELDENTLIILTSDNGGLSTSEGSNTSNYPLRAGKGWLYEGGIRVPAIIYRPGASKSGEKSDIPVTSMDFYPTILEYAGIDLNPEQHMDGSSLISLIDGSGETDEFDERPLFWHYPHYSNQGPQIGGAVLKNRFKLIENFETGETELYDLSYDVGERNNIALEKPLMSNELLQLLRKWRNSLNADMPDSF